LVPNLDQLNEPPNAGVLGIIFSNELLDAMPVHRFGWDAARKAWFEWGVALDAGRFVWAKLPEAPATQDQLRKTELPEALLNVLPDGFVAELCPAADAWWRKAAGLLREGKLLTLDYGLTAEELFAPERTRGTLRAFFRHHLNDELLSNAGDQDLTAHVNFTALQSAGESAGLNTTMFASQEKFLTQIAQRTFQRPVDFDEWTSARTRQFQTLTHPEHLGRSFRALVQSR
jgi:SAM-dependent MidA family methyltransferase